MINENDVRNRISELLKSEISIADFARWIMSNSWNMHQDSSADAVSLVSEIHSLLAERDDFLLNDAEFIHELSTLSNTVVVAVPVDIDARIVRLSPRLVNSQTWLVPAIHPVSV
jgi:hypothetical protein